jgi:transcriptional regulator with XRE-family HTH domain
MKIIFDLHKIRSEKRVTQKHLARLSGLSQSHISELETGMETPTLKTVEKISIALRIHPYKLIKVEESEIEYYL